MTQEALKELLEAVEAAIQAGDWSVDGACDPDLVIRRSKEALAEHAMRKVQRLGQEIEQEPVAWLSTDSIGERHLCFDKPLDNDPVQPLYTAPPQRTEQEPEEHRLLRRKWFGHRDTGHLSFTEAVDVTMEKIYSQPKQEPVAWMDADGNVSDNNDHKCFPIPLYTHPPQRTWVGLNEDEIDYLIHLAYTGDEEFVQTIEAKLKEKNCG